MKERYKKGTECSYFKIFAPCLNPDFDFVMKNSNTSAFFFAFCVLFGVHVLICVMY